MDPRRALREAQRRAADLERQPQALARRRLIGLRAGQSPNAELRVLAHECAHAMGVGYSTYGRERAECIVECATYMALA